MNGVMELVFFYIRLRVSTMERYILPVRKKSGGFGKYRTGGTFGSGAFHGKIRECQGGVIPGIVT